MTDEIKKEEEPPKIPEVLPVLPLRDIVIFPFMIVPLYVIRERSIKAVDQALAENRMILLAAQKNASDDDPTTEAIYGLRAYCSCSSSPTAPHRLLERASPSFAATLASRGNTPLEG